MKVISGAQTGADIAGLRAAKEYGLTTGGWMPLGFKAQDGNHPKFAELYGIQEHHSPNYPPRTALNVKESDGTVRFATKMNSAGEKCTLRMIQQYGKPHFDVDPLNENDTPQKMVEWIYANNVDVLNIAGNSERTSPGIKEFVVAFMCEVFEGLGFIMNEITFTKVKLPFGWLGNMSPFPVTYDGDEWRTIEALFQALRFEDQEIIDEIWDSKSPMTSKMIAKKHKAMMVIEPLGEIDLNNMRLCLRLKVEQHPQIKKDLLLTGNARIIEDVTSRGRRGSNLFWGSLLENGEWEGENWLGILWGEIRDGLATDSRGTHSGN